MFQFLQICRFLVYIPTAIHELPFIKPKKHISNSTKILYITIILVISVSFLGIQIYGLFMFLFTFSTIWHQFLYSEFWVIVCKY